MSDKVPPMTDWPACLNACSGHGACSHIGVCSCDREWGGDDCSQPLCAAKCSGHGKCGPLAQCTCDAGYALPDCARRAPPSPPPYMAPIYATAVAPPLTNASSLTLIGRSAAGRPLGKPLTTLLPPGAPAVPWGVDGAPPQALRVLLGTHSRVDAAAPLGDAVEPGSSRGERRKRASATALQTEPEAEASGESYRSVGASAVDWRTGRAYVAMAADTARGLALVQLALPSLATLASSPLPSPDMAEASAMALGTDADGSSSSWLHVLLAGSGGKRAELLVMHLPEMQATHALRFDVPSPVRAAHYDGSTAMLYLLCTDTYPKLLKVQMRGGQPAAAPSRGDTLPLPWGRALPLLLPFPALRQMLVLSADDRKPDEVSKLADPSQAPYDPPPMRVCRVRLGVPLQPQEGCVELRGGLAAEEVLSGVADDATGAAYLGCRSGALLRLRLSPLRIEEKVRPSASPLAASLLRPADGALWCATEAGEILQLSTRAGPNGASALAMSAPALAPPPSPSPPPPPSPPAEAVSTPREAAAGWTLSLGRPAGLGFGAQAAPAAPAVRSLAGAGHAPGGNLWLFDRLGPAVTVVLVLIAGLCGSMIGSRMYRLCRLCVRQKPAPQSTGFAQLPK